MAVSYGVPRPVPYPGSAPPRTVRKLPRRVGPPPAPGSQGPPIRSQRPAPPHHAATPAKPPTGSGYATWAGQQGIPIGPTAADVAATPPTPPMPARPNQAQEDAIQRRIDALPSIYNPQRAVAQERTKTALAGYGDIFTWQADNPATPEDESLIPVANPNASANGDYYTRARNNVGDTYGARNAYFSSWRQNAQSDAYRNLSERARGIVNQYADTLARIGREQQSEEDSLRGTLTGLYGDDAKWVQGSAFNATGA